jgi:hypothetical protein
MKTLISFLVILAWTITLSAQTVYITKTGSKYHISSCRHLSQSKISISLSEARERGYGPCSVCKPPVQTNVKNPNQKTETNQLLNSPSGKSDNKQQLNTSTTDRQQCAAITQAGTRCKRLAQVGSRYCWQHQK